MLGHLSKLFVVSAQLKEVTNFAYFRFSMAAILSWRSTMPGKIKIKKGKIGPA